MTRRSPSPRRRALLAVTRARDAAPFRLVCRQLEDCESASARPHAPGPDVSRDLHDLSVLRKEHGVDRETHEERVDRWCGLDQEAFTCDELAFSKQPLHAREHS